MSTAPKVQRWIESEEAKRGRTAVRKFGAGKSSVHMTGPAEYLAAAHEALARSFTTQAIVLDDQFRRLMKEKGVPDEVIEEFLRSASIDDESYLSERRH